MHTYIITGVTGYIGSVLTNYIRKSEPKARIIALVRNIEKAKTEEAIGRGMMTIFEEFGKIRTAVPNFPEAQELVKRLQSFISEHYYNCTPEILMSLGTMFAGGGEFTENIDAAGGKGTAQFAADAISIYCK